MTKINHNRPELRYKDNLRRVYKLLEAREVGTQEKYTIVDVSESIWESEDPSEAHALRLCRRVFEAALNEGDLFAKRLGIGRISGADREETNRLRAEETLKLQREYDQAIESLKVAAEGYNAAWWISSGYLRGSVEDPKAHKVLKEFYRQAIRAARKNSVLATAVLEAIRSANSELFNNESDQGTGKR